MNTTINDKSLAARETAMLHLAHSPAERAAGSETESKRRGISGEAAIGPTGEGKSVGNLLRRGRPVRWLVIAAAAAVVGVAGWQAHSQMAGHGQIAAAEATDAEGSQRKNKASLGFAPVGGGVAQSADAATRFATVPVEVVRRQHTLQLTGNLVADEQSSVASNVNGIVLEVRVDRGSMVKKGDVLVQLDPTDWQNRLGEGIALVDELKAKVYLESSTAAFVVEEQPAVKLAKATLSLAASRLRRAEQLLPKQAISQEEGEQIRAENECAAQRYRQALLEVQKDYQAYQTNVSKLAALRKAVKDTTILAPFDGMIVEKHVAPGEQVTGGFIATKIVTLVRTNPLRISLVVPQQEIGQIAQGEKVLFHVDCFPERTFEGEARYISPVVTNDTRSLVVDAVVPNADGVLRPGLFATAELQLPQQQTELLVPSSAVQRIDEVARVFVVRDAVAREQIVALGKTVQDKVQICSGLTGEERLVARPELVRDGDAVSSEAVRR
jgi:membrane fusion protein, multidrug efflux system